MADTLLNQLPAIYQDSGSNWFLHIILESLEQVFLGGTGEQRDALGLREKITRLPELFDPRKTPATFLDWLSGWVALTIRADLSEAKRRDIIANIVPLYEIRGTAKGVRETIRLFTDCEAVIEEPPDIPLQIGVHSSLARDMYLNGPPPHTFHVTLRVHRTELVASKVPTKRPDVILAFARAAIEMTKPAHTRYTLSLEREDKQTKAE